VTAAKHAAGGGSITVTSATAIGVGGMMGAGLYTLLGLASTTAGVWLPLAFVVGGVVSVFSVYSYAKLGAKYPSRGGAAHFLIRCFGDGLIAGGLNVFQFLGWIIAMALYCAGFAGYVRALLPWETPAWSGKVIGIGLIVAVVLVNMVGSKLVGRSELFVAAIELAILAVFAVFGAIKADPARLAENGDHHWLGVLFAAGLLYVTYEGFGVVTNSAGDMSDPARELPRAMFSALAIVVVVYVVISTIVVMTLSLPAMDANQGHVLSEAGLATLGHVGFVVIGVAALLGRGGTVGLLVAATLTALFVVFSSTRSTPASTWVTLLAVLALSFVFEIVYRKRTGRSLKSSRLPSARLLYANVEWARQEVCARRAISPRLRVLCALAPRSRGVRIATAWR
jgi:amino acid transporter